MNSVSGIFMALSLILSGGYASDKILTITKRAAVEHIHRGLPSLPEFSNRLTCSKISPDGNLVTARCRTRSR
jgi:hypothetical protein